ncbi:winged helix-turn-helix domain-containing protein [Aurantiacibacter odishensis]|uniref:winged helix-turn-helix domain-containing protein n=1 Tax=Aurantiacibacter odishensis TaxID=1155476 RepID=UPI000E71AC0A|nr:helix-turn-helix domain-containing protein [Aurantiacibacter odishensis]
MNFHNCPNCGYQLRQSGPLTYGNVALYEDGLIYLNGESVELARTQYEVVQALVRAKGRGLTLESLASLIDDEIEEVTVRQYVRRARLSLSEVDHNFDQIEALCGFGAYRWKHRPITSTRFRQRRSRYRSHDHVTILQTEH